MPFVTTGCGLCRSDQRAAIDAAILARGEKSWRTLAAELGLPRPTVQRHAPHAVAAPVVEPPALVAPVPAPPPAPAPVAPPSEPAAPARAEASPSPAPAASAPAPPPSDPLALRTGHPCATCRSPHRAAIEEAVFELAPLKAIEARFPTGPSDNSIRRHIDRCMRARLEDAMADRFGSAREEADGLLKKARRLLDEAEGTGDFGDRAKSLAAAKGIVELLARITGEIAPPVNIQMVLALPDWQRMEGQLVAALLPHPEALRAVKVVLGSMRAPALPSGER